MRVVSYKEKTLEPSAEFLKAYTDPADEGCWYIAYSGGKDSTVAAAEVMRIVMALPSEKRTRKVHIVSAQTTLDLTTDPTKQRKFERMRKSIAKHNLPFEIHETVNDLDGEVSNLFSVIRDNPEALARAISWTPYARAEYYRGYESEGDYLERARRFLVRCWMARVGKTSDRTGWRHIIDLNAPHPAKDWQLLPDKIMTVTGQA